MLDYLLGFVAGLLTVLSPCVFPILPLIAASASQKSRFGPVALVFGLSLAFVIIGVAVALSGDFLGVKPRGLRTLSATFLMIFSFTLINKRAGELLARVLSPLATKAQNTDKKIGTGLIGQFVAGALLGVVWSPCSGPTLGAAISLAAQLKVPQATLLMTSFSIGASLPLLAIAYGARLYLKRHTGSIVIAAGEAKLIFGWILFVIGLILIFGLDKLIETKFLQFMPNWLIDLLTRF